VGKTSPSIKETPQHGPEEDFEHDWFSTTTDKSRQIIHKKFNSKFLEVLLFFIVNFNVFQKLQTK
jgi:hypothetical protein